MLRKAHGVGGSILTSELVIRHGRPDLFAQMPPEQAAQAERAWQALQTQLGALSSNSRLVVAEESGHAIQIDQPEMVVAPVLAWRRRAWDQAA